MSDRKRSTGEIVGRLLLFLLSVVLACFLLFGVVPVLAGGGRSPSPADPWGIRYTGIMTPVFAVLICLMFWLYFRRPRNPK